MSFDHERLDVYQAALDFVVLCEDVLEQLPRGLAHLVDQLSRASTSIVLNIAEGAGKYHKPDKRRFYLTAAGSATESAAVLDICGRLKLIDPELQRRGKEILHRVVAMLVKLATALERTVSGAP